METKKNPLDVIRWQSLDHCQNHLLSCKATGPRICHPRWEAYVASVGSSWREGTPDPPDVLTTPPNGRP